MWIFSGHSLGTDNCLISSILLEENYKEYWQIKTRALILIACLGFAKFIYEVLYRRPLDIWT